MFNICDAMFAHRPEKKGKLFQSGIKFKSLCSKCNNDYLGARYDPSINQLSKDLADIVKTPLAVPPVASISVQVNRVCRAVLGHLMAVGLDRYNDGEMANSCREYFLNSEIKEPKNVKIYYWVYPYNRQVLIRDATVTFDLGNMPPVFFWLIKYFPIAFFVTCNEPQGFKFRVNLLNQILTSDIDEFVSLRLTLRNIPKSNWPEAPVGNSIVALSDQAHGSYEKRRRKKS